MEIGQTIRAIESGRIRISDHADEEARADGISIEQALHRVAGGETIERQTVPQLRAKVVQNFYKS